MRVSLQKLSTHDPILKLQKSSLWFSQPLKVRKSVGGKLYMESARVDFQVALLTDGWDQTESLLLLFIGCTLAYC